MNVSEYIVKHLEDYGVKHIFSIVGGGAMFLNEAFSHSKIKTIFMHHEQACAMAAEGYSRITNELSVVCVTSGPGSLNCLTGVMGQWTDSIPVLYISGQVKTSNINHNRNLRQLGDQEVAIIPIVTPITKRAGEIYNSEEIKIVLPHLIEEATTGRKAPVWLSVPWDIQQANV